MNDQVETDVQETETPEAPKVKAPKVETVTSFAPQGELALVTIEPVDADNEDGLIEKLVTVQYGILTTKRGDDEAKTAHRFEVTYPRVVDGVDEGIVRMSTKADKALDMALKAANKGTGDDYLIGWDLEEDFYKQKLASPPAVKESDIWHHAKYKDVLGSLNEMRGEIENTLAKAQDSEVATQSDWLGVAELLIKANKFLGGDKAALKAFVLGDGEGGNNMPLLSKLGKGTNAIAEAMELGKLSNSEYAVLPATTISGKAVNRHRSIAIAAAVEEAARKTAKELVLVDGIPDIASSALLIRAIATHAFGVDNAAEMELEALVEAVDVSAGNALISYSTEVGKHVNVYDTQAYDMAKRVFAKVHISESGAGLFGAAVGQLMTASQVSEDSRAGELKALYSKMKNLMMGKALELAVAHSNTNAQETENREVMNNVEEVDKKVVTAFAALDPLAAAAGEFKKIASHPKAAEVWGHLKALASQYGDQLAPAVEEVKEAAE